MSTKPKTKSELIDLLIERGTHARPALTRMNRAALAALAEDAESVELLAAEEASSEAAKPKGSGKAPAPTAAPSEVRLPIEEVQVGDVWGGTKVAAVQFGPRWCYLQSKQGTWFLRVVAGQQVQVVR